MNDPLGNPQLKYAIPIALLAGLIWLSYAVMRDFLSIIFWALIIAYVTWPAFLKLKGFLPNRLTLCAAIMTGIITVLIFLIVFWLLNSIQSEIRILYQILLANIADPPPKLPESLSNIPWLGDYLQQLLNELNTNSAGLKVKFLDWAKQWLGGLGQFLSGIGRNLITLGFILVTLFFCFRDGEKAIAQLQLGLHTFLGKYQNIYLQAAGNTARAVVYGVVLASLAQGLIAGLGYSVAGVNAPALFGAMTALLAMIPMGAPLIWLPISLGLILSGEIWRGAGLLFWGIFVISTVDNVIRPLVISGTGRIPFIIVLFGIFGGLSAFGIVGLFLGPIILSVLFAVWQAWLKQQEAL